MSDAHRPMDTATDFSRVELLLHLTQTLESGTRDGVRDALTLASEMFSQARGIVSRISGDSWTVDFVGPEGSGLERGDRFAIEKTFCRETLRADDVVAIADAAQTHGAHPCFVELGVVSYIGVPLRVHGQIRGTLAFSASVPRPSPWTQGHRQLMRLIGRWVEATLEQGRLRRHVADIAGVLADSNTAQRAMRRAREALLAALPDVLLVVDADGVCRRVQAPDDLHAPFPHPLGAVVLSELFGPEVAEHLRAELVAALESGRLRVTEISVGPPDAVRIYEARIAPVTAEAGPPTEALILLRDLSDRAEARRLAEQRAALERTNARLRIANEELDAFAYAASHDLKSPLRALSNLSTWILEELGELEHPEVQRYLHLMDDRVGLLARLVDGLLAWSRVGREAVHVSEVDSASVVAEVVRLLDPASGFEVVVADDLPQLSTAWAPLQRVFANAIGNALQHHDRDQGRVAVSVRPAGPGWVEFSVEDDGPGIPEALREDAFAVFRRLSRSGQTTGTGLGLALVRKTVEAAGGRVWVEAVEPRGLALRFTWPLTWPSAPDQTSSL